MISVRIEEIKHFMSILLSQPVFDHFLFFEAELYTALRITMQGKMNRSFFSGDELGAMDGREYMLWEEVRPLVFQMMKGNKVPTAFKIVLLLSKENTRRIVEQCNAPAVMEEVGGFYLNIKFENSALSLITGTSLKVFTMDKTLEREWDERIKRFLRKNSIPFC